MTYLIRAFVARLFYCLLVSTAVKLVMRAACAAIVLTALGLGLPATNAAAGVFQVANCQADPLNYSTRAFTHRASRRMMIKRACNPAGPGMRGLITANVVHDGRVKRGSFALLTFDAPPGTRMTTFRWAGSMRRADCRFALQLWADAPDITAIPLKNMRANRRCPSRPRAQAAYDPPKPYNVTGATRIVQRIICVGSAKQNWCSARGRNYVRTYQARVDIVDYIPPVVQILQDTPLATGSWVTGNQPLNYTASDNVGVQRAGAVITGAHHSWHTRACLLASPSGPFADPFPCPNGPGQITVRALDLPEGSQPVVVEAEDSAGNLASSTAVTARIDNTPPARVDASIEGGENWRTRNEWAVAWTNPTEVDRAPIVAANYTVCSAGTTTCTRGTRTESNISRLQLAVPHPGEWTVSVWTRDAAGNEAEDNASVPVTLRYDPEPPQLAFEPLDAPDPTLIAVRANDQVSGIADGVIEISATGSGMWQTLATEKDGNRFVTRIDDAALPAGVYVLRARARDQAGNEASTDRRDDGQPMVITLPLRTPVTVGAGFERKVRQGRRRNEVVVRPSAQVRFGERVKFVGRVVTSGGHPISGASLQLLSRVGTESEQIGVSVGVGGERGGVIVA